MQFSHRAFGLLPGGQQGIGVRAFTGERAKHGLREGAERVFPHRHQVGAAQLEELDPVLQEPQITVGVVEFGGVRPSDVAAGGEGGYGRGCVPVTKGFVGLAVHQLQQLNREFDIAQAAAAQFDLALLLIRRDVVRDPPAHGLYGFHETFPVCRTPDQG
ncbi:hypothetical protein D9M72_550810 [compost metagenome]